MARKKLEKDDTKKTANGLGSLDELPSGKWRWRVSFRAAGGKRVRLGGTEKSETAAKRALNKAVTDNERGTLASPDRVTVAEYAKRWLESQPNLRMNTRRMYGTELDYALEIIGNERLRDVRPTDIQSLLKTLSKKVMGGGGARGKTMSARTANMVRARLRSVFGQAIQDQLIYVNPVAAVKRVKPDQDEDKPGVALEVEQSARLHELGEALHAAGVCRLWPALFAALSVGLRRGEVMGLRWEDVDFETNTLRVRQNLTENNGAPTLTKPKTGNSVRDIPMLPSLRASLEHHRVRQVQECATLGRAWSVNAPVFPTLEGAYTAPSNLLRALKNVLAWSDPQALTAARVRGVPRDHRAVLEAVIKSGEALPDIRVHDLRHTAGTQMLRRKMPIESVSRILGHANISITLDVYRHVSERELRLEMVDLFDAPLPVRAVPVVTMN